MLLRVPLTGSLYAAGRAVTIPICDESRRINAILDYHLAAYASHTLLLGARLPVSEKLFKTTWTDALSGDILH